MKNNSVRRKSRRKAVALITAFALVCSLIAGMSAPRVEAAAGAQAGSAAGKDVQEWSGTSFDGGNGTEEDPYRIADGSNLAYLSAQVAAGRTFSGQYIKLTEDIDLALDNNTEVLFTPIGGGAKQDDGLPENKFLGTFDGNGKTISHLYVNNIKKGTVEPNFTGLFGYNGGTIKNLTVEGSVTAESSKLEKTYSEPSSDFVGGVVGFNAGTIRRVVSRVAIKAEYSGNVGGIAGFNTSGKWRDSTTGQDINRTIEGAVGLVTECSNAGNIKSYKKIGGITGENEGSISYCSNSGEIYTRFSGKGNGQGGITGRNGCNNAEWGVGRIFNCYNTGAINAKGKESSDHYFDSRWIGGISGFSSSSSRIRNCYNIGCIYKGYADYFPVSARMDNPEKNASNCYSLARLNYCYNADGTYNGRGADYNKEYAVNYFGSTKKESELKSNSFLQDLGGAFAADNEGSAAVNNGYPILRWQATASTAVTGIAKTKDPDKTHYVAGQTFDPSGLKIVASYSDGSTYTLCPCDYTISNAGELTTDDTLITVSGSFGGHTFSYDIPIQVSKNALASIKVTKGPERMPVYRTGETFEADGMEITAAYTNGQTKKMKEGFTYTETKLSPTDKTITVSYTEDGVTKTDSFEAEVVDLTEPEKNGDGAYMIDSAADLNAVSTMVSVLGKTDFNVILTKDITADSDFRPIGVKDESRTITTVNGGSLRYFYYTNAFSGKFNGGSHRIALALDSDSSAEGLFGCLGESAEVRDLTTTGSISSNGAAAGIAVCVADESDATDQALIENCHNEAKIKGGTSAAGIVGKADTNTEIRKCTNAGTVKGTDYVGGILASGTAELSECFNNSTVCGQADYIGGIAGSCKGSLSKCGNTAAVSGTRQVGGICGAGVLTDNMTFQQCFNIGSVEGVYHVGGIIGRSYAGALSSCYNWGAISASDGAKTQGVGGLVGTQQTYALTVENSYNYGPVTGSKSISTGSLVGAIDRYQGSAALQITNCYYLKGSAAKSVGLMPTNEAAHSDASRPQTSAQMENGSATLGEAFQALQDCPPVFVWQSAPQQINELKQKAAEAKTAGVLKLKTASASYNSLHLSWNAAAAPTGYHLLRATSKNGSYYEIAFVKGTSYTDRHLTCGTTYYYKLRAEAAYQDTDGASHTVVGDFSSISSAKPIPAKVSVRAAAGKKRITVRWHKIAGAGGYSISISTRKSRTRIVKTLKGSAKVKYTKKGLKRGRIYYVKVRAYRKTGRKKVYGSWSSLKRVRVR